MVDADQSAHDGAQRIGLHDRLLDPSYLDPGRPAAARGGPGYPTWMWRLLRRWLDRGGLRPSDAPAGRDAPDRATSEDRDPSTALDAQAALAALERLATPTLDEAFAAPDALDLVVRCAAALCDAGTPWPERLDPLLGRALREAGRRSPDRLREVVTSLPTSRREAVLVPNLHVMRTGDWLSVCPTPRVLLAHAKQLERHHAPADSLRADLRQHPEVGSLVSRACELLRDAAAPTGARALLPVLFDDPDVAPDAWAEVFEVALADGDEALDSAFSDAFGRLSLQARERVVLSLPPTAGGPHRLVPTPAVARTAVAQLLAGDPAVGAEILHAMPDAHVRAALEAHPRASADGARVQVLAWTLRHDLATAPPVQQVVSIGSATVLDVRIVGDEVVASCADGSLVSIAPDGEVRVLVPGEEDSVSPCRIVAVTEATIVRWGWEHLQVLDRRTGRYGSDDLGHGLDEYEGDCSVHGTIAMLPSGSLLDLDARRLVPAPVDLPEPRCHAVDGAGFLIAIEDRLERMDPAGGRTLLQAFPEPIRAILATDPVAVVVDGGRVLAGDGTVLGVLELEARRDDGRARHQPRFPAEAAGCWDGERLIVAMNDRGLRLRDSCLSGVAVFEGGRLLWSREYRGRAALAPGVPAVAVPDAVLAPCASGMRAVALPGLRPVCATSNGGQLVVGTADGLVVSLVSSGPRSG